MPDGLNSPPVKKHTPRISLISAALAATAVVSAQLTVNNALTPQQIVQTVLLGPGVTASNITFQGDPDQLGTFNGSASNIGMGAGMIMATGSINVAPGPNNAGGLTLGGGNWGVGDPDLDSIVAILPVPGTTHDRAVLEFDFVPTGDSLAFNFILASEEYDEYVCGTVTDVFAFFLSGPGINGPFSNNAVNIALVPGTNVPVAINTVNIGVPGGLFPPDNCDAFDPNWAANSIYYVQNNPIGITVQYDGFTVVLSAQAQVQCGQVYHIKLAIADVGDTAWDSAVFIEAGSFQSNAVSLSTQIDAGGQDSTIYEGCGQATLFLTRAGDLSQQENVQFITGGVAVEGADYNNVANTFTFLPGEDSLQVIINATLDALTEGPELVELLAIANGNCGVDSTFLYFYIDDAPPINLVMSNDTTLPCNDSVLVSGLASGGFGALVLDWDQIIADGTTSDWVAPMATTTYTLTVTDDCGVHTVVGDVTVTVPVPDPLVVVIAPDTTVLCPESPVDLNTTTTGGTTPYSYTWSGALGNNPTAAVAPPTTQSWTVTVTDNCGVVATDVVTVVVQYDTIAVVTSADTSICRGDTAFLSALASFGTGAYTYVWNSGVVGPANPIAPSGNGTYTVTATDECGISSSDDVTVGVNAPVASFSYTGSVYVENFPVQFLDESVGATAWSWDFEYPDLVSTEQNPVVVYPAAGMYDVMLAIVDDLGCVDTTYRSILIDPELHFYAPNAFTPDGDGTNEAFFGAGVGLATYHMRIFNRWGELVHDTDELFGKWDGTAGGVEAPEGVYTYWFRVQGISGEVQEHLGHVTLVR